MSLRPLALVPVFLLLAGCGSDPKPQPALSPVRLTVDGPSDTSTTDDSTVEVHGRVSPPGAKVLVDGDEAGVTGGTFSALVQLDEGTNIIDITAGAPRRRAAMTAIRVTRRVPVTIPVLRGYKPEDAQRRLEDLGLKVTFHRGGGLFDDLLPGTLGVCGSDPNAGESVRVGTSVEVEIAKSC